MKSRAELKDALAHAESKLINVTSKQLAAEWVLHSREDELSSYKEGVRSLGEQLEAAEKKAEDNIREQALSFSQDMSSRNLHPSTEEILRRAANYELYLRTGVSVPVYTSERSSLDDALAKLWDTATDEQYAALSAISAGANDLRNTYKAALKTNEMHKEREEQLTQAAQELVDALVWSAEYAGLPASEGWSWYDALKKHAPAALESFVDRQKASRDINTVKGQTGNEHEPVTTEALGPDNETIRQWVINLMAPRGNANDLREAVEEALEWVLEDDSQQRFEDLALTNGNLQRAKIVHALRIFKEV